MYVLIAQFNLNIPKNPKSNSKVFPRKEMASTHFKWVGAQVFLAPSHLKWVDLGAI